MSTKKQTNKTEAVVREFADGSRTVHIAPTTRAAKGLESARSVDVLLKLVAETVAQQSSSNPR